MFNDDCLGFIIRRLLPDGLSSDVVEIVRMVGLMVVGLDPVPLGVNLMSIRHKLRSQPNVERNPPIDLKGCHCSSDQRDENLPARILNFNS